MVALKSPKRSSDTDLGSSLSRRQKGNITSYAFWWKHEFFKYAENGITQNHSFIVGVCIQSNHYLYKVHDLNFLVDNDSGYFGDSSTWTDDVIIKTIKHEHHCFLNARISGMHEIKGYEDINDCPCMPFHVRIIE